MNGGEPRAALAALVVPRATGRQPIEKQMQLKRRPGYISGLMFVLRA